MSWRTAHGWFRRWQEQGLFDALLRRRAGSRKAGPRLAVIGTQPVKSAFRAEKAPALPVRGPRGFDAANKVPGRKRGALVDTAKPPGGLCGDGTWLAVVLVPVNIQERNCLPALTDGKQCRPSLREAVLDGAFAAEQNETWCNHHGMWRRLVKRHPDRKGFVVLERRWVVERSFGWLAHWGRLLRDHAGRLDLSAARIACAAVLFSVEAPTNPLPAQNKAA